ncbi:MAG: hypothetical protein HQ568_00475, partial [Calditrichaeota bacterium]|nr:hypothetical protein [Calditrichota bacterium]
MRLFLTVLTIIILIGTDAQAYKLYGGSLSLKLTYRGSYDSNILKYSERDRDRFIDDQEPYNSPITTLDDIRSDFKVSARYSRKFIPKLRTSVSITGDFAHYLINSIKNFGWISATIKQEITDQLSASLNYFYDIEYYIRDYKDIHSSNREHCNFSMDQWTGKVYYRPVKPFEFVIEGRYKKYAYNKYFTEYDSDYLEIGSEVIYRNNPWRLAFGYSLADNDNVGFTSFLLSDAGDGEDNEAGDGDYQQDTYSLSVRYGMKAFGRKARFLSESTIRDRYYLTERNINLDPMHAGRNDVMLKTELSF